MRSDYKDLQKNPRRHYQKKFWNRLWI